MYTQIPPSQKLTASPIQMSLNKKEIKHIQRKRNQTGNPTRPPKAWETHWLGAVRFVTCDSTRYH
jgi:hypothetical protein